MTATESTELISLSTAADLLGVQTVTMRRGVAVGRIAGIRVRVGAGSVILVTPAEVERYRRTYLGRRGPTTDRCQECRVREAAHTADAGHPFAPDPRRAS